MMDIHTIIVIQRLWLLELMTEPKVDWLNKVLYNGKSILIEQTYSQGSCWIIEFWLGPRGAGVKWGLCLLKSLLELDIRRNNVWGKIENGIRIKLTSVFKAPCSWRGEDIFLIFLFLPWVFYDGKHFVPHHSSLSHLIFSPWGDSSLLNYWCGIRIIWIWQQVMS